MDSLLSHIGGTKEAAILWGRSPDHIKLGCREGWIKAKKVGRDYAIDLTQKNPFSKDADGSDGQ